MGMYRLNVLSNGFEILGNDCVLRWYRRESFNHWIGSGGCGDGDGKIGFDWYLKKISLPVLIGYFLGIGSFLMIYHVIYG